MICSNPSGSIEDRTVVWVFNSRDCQPRQVDNTVRGYGIRVRCKLTDAGSNPVSLRYQGRLAVFSVEAVFTRGCPYAALCVLEAETWSGRPGA